MTSAGRASGRSTLFTTSTTGSRASSAFRRTKRVCGSGPSLASTSKSTPSTIVRPRSTSPPKSACPGVSTMFTLVSPIWTAVFFARIVIPFSRSRSIESRTRSATSWFARNEPDCQRSASTSVVFPWSTCATMATFRRSSLLAVRWGRAGKTGQGTAGTLGPVPSEKPEPMTRAQKAQLESELRELEGPGRAQVVQAIATARGFGDLSENFEYHAAKNDQGLLEHRIRQIRDRLDRSLMVDETSSASGTIGVGSRAEIEDEHGERMSLEISSVGGVSPESPLGLALLGAKAGDEVDVHAPKGAWRARVLSVGV